MDVIVIVIIFGIVLLSIAFCRRRKTETLDIQVTDQEISCEIVETKMKKSIRWDDIQLITIDTLSIPIHVKTADTAGQGYDVMITLANEVTNDYVVLPAGLAKTDLVVDRILKFPGFDHRKFIQAMGSGEDAIFIVWEKKKTTM